jgi:integrase
MLSKSKAGAGHGPLSAVSESGQRAAQRRVVHLTEDWLTRFRLPDGVQRERWWDDKTTGLGVLVGRRFRTFFAARRVGSEWRYTSIGHHGRPHPDGGTWTLVKARAAAAVLLGRMEDGVDPHAEERARAGGPTLRDGLELHVARMRDGRNRRQRECSPRSIKTIETEVPRLLAAWMDRPLAELTAGDLQKVVDGIKVQQRAGAVNPPGRALANRLLAQVSAIWNSADRLHDLPGKNPARRLGAAALKPRDERIPDAGFAAWYSKVDKLPPVRRELHLMALFTGLRSESLRHLRWDDIDEERGLLRVSKAKGGRAYVVPLVAAHLELLARLRADRPVVLAGLGVPDDGGWVFPTRTRSGSLDPQRGTPPSVIPLAEPGEEGLPGLHALRRTYNSVAAEVGIAQGDREALLGHTATGVNAKHYTRPEDWQHLAECQERVAAALAERIGGARRGRKRRR